MIDPLISLAFALSTAPGTYALLLGSGVSRAAGIPTGWEVIEDLIRKVARASGGDSNSDPTGWYVKEFGTAPNYSRLLDMLAKTPAERSQLLRGYFEPTDEERRQGLKIPTKAHRAIASLVADGFIRIVVTTNFDRLIETAILEAGVTPTVIGTPDAVLGAVPLVHSSCTVLKLHGDYLDTRIRNTEEELGAPFDEHIGKLLDRILDEFGLVISGWSAEWDFALYSSIERTPNRRYSTYWTYKGQLSERAKRLADLRTAQTLPIPNADAFFQQLAEKVSAIVEFGKPHPLSVATAVATLKRYVVRSENRIALHDLVARETERCRGEISDARFPVQGLSITPELVTSRLQKYEAATEILRAVLLNGVYWGRAEFSDILSKTIRRIAAPVGVPAGLVDLIRLRRYPGSILFCAAGLAAVLKKDFTVLKGLFDVPVKQDDEKLQPVVMQLFPGNALPDELLRLVSEWKNVKTPASDHIFSVLRADFRDLVPDDADFDDLFDRFEYLVSLANVDYRDKLDMHLWAPTGRFGWRGAWSNVRVIDQMEAEADKMQDSWPPVKAELFDGKYSRFKEVATAYRTGVLKNLQWTW